MNMYRIYDSKAESFSNPFYENTDASAVRAFVSSVRTPDQSGMRGDPADYTLVAIGSIEHDQALPVLKAAETLIDGTTALQIARDEAVRRERDLNIGPAPVQELDVAVGDEN